MHKEPQLRAEVLLLSGRAGLDGDQDRLHARDSVISLGIPRQVQVRAYLFFIFILVFLYFCSLGIPRQVQLRAHLV